MHLSPGTRLGPFEILSPLGAGGMGEVYRARDTKLKREVALKVLPEALACDRERMARFQREAEMLAALNHPNIAAIYGLEKGALIMELVEGDNLKERIQRSAPLPDAEIRSVGAALAATLEYAHRRGIIHRDVKPQNVLLGEDGNLRAEARATWIKLG